MKITRLQAALLSMGAALLVLLAVTFRRVPRPRREPAPDSATAPGPAGVGQPTTLLSGFDYSESAGGRTRFSVHADRTVGFAQGAGLPSTWYRLERVALTLLSASGAPLDVKAAAGEYDPRSKAMNLHGNVVAHDAAGTRIEAEAVHFDPVLRRLTIPGSVRFSRGAVTGFGKSAVYATDDRVLTMAGPITAAGSGPGAPFDTLRADAGEYRETEGAMTLSGGVRTVRGPDALSADVVTFHLAADNRVDSAVAQGRVQGQAGNGAGVESYAADEARSRFDAAGRLDHVLLTGAPATVSAAAGGGQPERRLSAPRIDLGFDAGRLASADAEGRPRLDRTVPGRNGAPFSESITSDRAHATIAPDGSLSVARFEGNVLGVTIDGISRSPIATYAAASGVTTLLSGGGIDAELDSPRGKLVARRIDVDGKLGTITGDGEARAFLRPGDRGAGAPEFLASSRQPTRARARRIVFDDRARTARLTGDAALWQEENTLAADEIVLHDADRSALAIGHVRVSARSRPGAGEKAPERARIASARMRYDEGAKTAIFEEGVVAVRGSETARGDRGECRFDADRRVERTILDGHVSFEDRATSRRGSGARAVDEPAKGTTNLAGDPAVAQDGQGNRVQGAILTFRKESGSVEVKAKEGGRIESIYQSRPRSPAAPRDRAPGTPPGR